MEFYVEHFNVNPNCAKYLKQAFPELEEKIKHNLLTQKVQNLERELVSIQKKEIAKELGIEVNPLMLL